MRYSDVGAIGPFDTEHRQFVSDDTVVGIFQSRDIPAGNGTEQPTPTLHPPWVELANHPSRRQSVMRHLSK